MSLKIFLIFCFLQESTYEVASKVLREAFIIRRKKVSKNVLLAAIKQIGVTSLQGGTEILVNFLKDCIQIQPGSVAVTLLTKDDDVEVQGSWKNSVLPKVGSADLDVDKDPLIWEMSSLIKHCDPQVVKIANQIIGKNPHLQNLQSKIRLCSNICSLPLHRCFQSWPERFEIAQRFRSRKRYRSAKWICDSIGIELMQQTE